MKDILSRFKKNPLDFIRRALFKTIIGPLKYGKGDDYDAVKYWHDRFAKYGQLLRGAGDEGLSEEENEEMYTDAAKIFTDLCLKEGVDFQSARAIDIGCGTGFYTKVLYDLGVKNYAGVDITDVLFPGLRKKFPQYRFIKRDISSDRIEGKFDLIVMIDVISHIVQESKLSKALENLKNCLSPNGIFIISPIIEASKRYSFYNLRRSSEDIKQRFPGYIFRELVPFRGNYILIIRKP